MSSVPSLRRRLIGGLLAYVALLSLAVGIHGFVVNEHAEALVWTTLLDSELDFVLERMAREPDYHWDNTSTLAYYDERDPAGIPVELRGLSPGVHDEIMVGGVQQVVLLRDIDGRRVGLALDITDLEQNEMDLGFGVLVSALAMIVLLGIAVAYSANRLVQPVTELAQKIGELRPHAAGQRIQVDGPTSAEIETITGALNDYLQRHDRFVERERAFIDSASHELRTPIAVIAGASSIALQQADVPPAVHGQLSRIQRTSREVEQLITLLLVLAKDPARLARTHDRVVVSELIPEIIEDHRHLMRDKDLSITFVASGDEAVVAPLAIVQSAIGNLLRNAIENSDRGTITITVQAPATVVIEDPGHGMSPEEIAAVYARLARGSSRDGAGIGLSFLSRLCEHLDWKLDVTSTRGQGTVATLAMRSAVS